MSYHVMAYTPGPFEILRGVELPFLSPNAEIGSQATYDWYDRNIGFDKEFQDVKVVTIFVYTTPFAIMMNRAKYESLSDDHKKVLAEVGGVNGAKMLGAGWDRADVAGKATGMENRGNVSVISDAELARWKEKASFMDSDWIKKADDAGLDGAALLEDLKATIAKYAAQ